MEEQRSNSFRKWFRFGAFALGWVFIVLSMFVFPKETSLLRQFTLGGLGLLTGCAFLLLRHTNPTLAPDQENPTLYSIGAYSWGVIGVLFLLGVLK